jgi:type II secretory pathway component PulF
MGIFGPPISSPPQIAILVIMLFSSQISTRELAQLCHRLAISEDAGIDARTLWSRETERASGNNKIQFATISQAVNKGESLRDAINATGDFFPVLFRELVAVGEQAGRLDAVFSQLSEHYQNQFTLRRQFLAAIVWPLIQLTMSIVVIGFLIWIMGAVREMANSNIDPLGLGLYGDRGLSIYISFILIAAVLLWIMIRAARRGLAWTRPIQRILMRLPGLGKALETLALARLAWTLHLTLEAGVAVRQALRLSLNSTNNARFIDKIDSVDAEIENGNSIHEAFVKAGCFPIEFLDATAVGEESGKLTNAMANLSRQYQEQARYALKTINSIAAFLVWLVIAAIIISAIFRLALFYVSAINQAAGV